MKMLLLLPFVVIGYPLFAQSKLPVIRAHSKKALIIEGEDEKHHWNISPEAKPDVHTLTKSVKPKRVAFYTDIDSIKMTVKPGEQFDFIVLLNDKDSCYTRMEGWPVKNYSHQKPATHDTISFTLTEFNNLKVSAVLNSTDTLDLKFDSGTTGLLLTNDAIKQKTRLADPEKPNNSLQMGNMTWDSLRVYPVVLSGQETDGRFGWDLFDGKIVEIDYDKNLFIVHTRAPKISKAYTRFDMEYLNTLFCIQGALEIKNKKYPGRFLFDNGYQRTIMLDTVIMHEQNYPRDMRVIKTVIMRNGQGKEIPLITVNNEQLKLGKYALFNIPVQLMTAANPARFKTHILGNEVLKRFNTILDFQNNYVYVKPNHLVDLPYIDAK